MTEKIRIARGGGATLTEQVHEVVTSEPGKAWRVDEIVPLLPEIDRRQISNVLTRGVTLGRYSSVRAGGPGRHATYTYPPAGTPADPPEVSTPDELRPIIEAIPDDAYKAAGLQPVAMAADGARICVDDQGTAWKVRVIVEARLV